MTLQMAVGKLVLDKVAGQPLNYPADVVHAARTCIKHFHEWNDNPARPTCHESNWHTKSASWRAFKAACAAHHIDLPALLAE
jgi:hypothetical protein